MPGSVTPQPPWLVLPTYNEAGNIEAFAGRRGEVNIACGRVRA